MTQPICPICQSEVPPKARTGPVATYCSRKCRSRASYNTMMASDSHAARKVAALKPLTDRVCAVCSSVFQAKRVDAVNCSKRCSTVARDGQSQESCAEESCERGIRARGLCFMHYRAWARAEGRIVQDGWTDRRRNNHHTRRALIKGTSSGGTVVLADILERDGNDCRICLEPVDMALKWPHPFSQSLDHIVPIARGGAHIQSNCQLAHLRCNISKGVNAA